MSDCAVNHTWHHSYNQRQINALKLIHSFIHSLHAFQSADQVRCSRQSMAALQPALSWDCTATNPGLEDNNFQHAGINVTLVPESA